jgi:DMSO/TMAO reductase YedYZ molybdopterin-dependent catalytic subunit
MSIIKRAPSVHRPQGGVDQSLLLENRKLVQGIDRRGLLRGTLSLGAVTLLTGCDISNEQSLQTVLRSISRWNDRVQAWLFNPNVLAPTYTDAQVARPPRFNAFYGKDQVKPVDGDAWRLELAGLVGNKQSWTKDALYGLPQETQITRHICVEGWDYIGKWSGAPLKAFLERVGADMTAKFVGFKCPDGYSSSIDMPTALHPQTILATHYDGAPLPAEFGFPVRLKTPLKLGFKQPKWITAIEVTNTNPGGYWEQGGYNWFSGL